MGQRTGPFVQAAAGVLAMERGEGCTDLDPVELDDGPGFRAGAGQAAAPARGTGPAR